MHPIKAILLSFVLAPVLVLAQTAPALKPTSKPAMLPPTPEQLLVIDQVRKESAAAPAPKRDLSTGTPGKPNANFGQIQGGFLASHKSFMERKAKPIGVLFLGDSITAGWGRAPEVWKNHFGKYDPANFGISGDRTQHILWRIDQGELDGISPKVVVLMIGTNNGGSYTADQIAAAVTKIVTTVHAKLPETKVLLLAIFPRAEKADNPVRVKLQQVNAAISKLDDGKQTRYLEIWKQFLADDGTLTKEIMPDFLHPNAKGYQIWAESMQPLLDEMMK